MDDETKKFVDFEVSHVKQTTSSPAMEKRGFQLCLDRALNSGISVNVMGTNRHIGIKALMKQENKDLFEEHQVVLESRATGEEPEPVAVPDLPKNIAPVPRPPREELQARHASRFGKTI